MKVAYLLNLPDVVPILLRMDLRPKTSYIFLIRYLQNSVLLKPLAGIHTIRMLIFVQGGLQPLQDGFMALSGAIPSFKKSSCQTQLSKDTVVRNARSRSL
ncbi:MAG: hypothetical protein PVI54_06465 [Desulfobacteraceae bacterium]